MRLQIGLLLFAAAAQASTIQFTNLNGFASVTVSDPDRMTLTSGCNISNFCEVHVTAPVPGGTLQNLGGTKEFIGNDVSQATGFLGTGAFDHEFFADFSYSPMGSCSGLGTFPVGFCFVHEDGQVHQVRQLFWPQPVPEGVIDTITFQSVEQASGIPEPGTLGLLLVGGLVAMLLKMRWPARFIPVSQAGWRAL